MGREWCTLNVGDVIPWSGNKQGRKKTLPGYGWLSRPATACLHSFSHALPESNTSFLSPVVSLWYFVTAMGQAHTLLRQNSGPRTLIFEVGDFPCFVKNQQQPTILRLCIMPTNHLGMGPKDCVYLPGTS